VELVSQDDITCAAVFRIINKTGLFRDTRFGFGGYGLEIGVTNINSESEWTIGNPQGATYLPPSPLDRDVRVVPINGSVNANVVLRGQPTPASLLADTSIFLLNALIAKIDTPIKCYVPIAKLLPISFRTMSIMEPAVGLLVKGDFKAAQQQITSRLPEFTERAEDSARAAGEECLAKLLGSCVVSRLLEISGFTSSCHFSLLAIWLNRSDRAACTSQSSQQFNLVREPGYNSRLV
jgi:hypothetical protein